MLGFPPISKYSNLQQIAALIFLTEKQLSKHMKENDGKQAAAFSYESKKPFF
jgi:hypothetical protein